MTGSEIRSAGSGGERQASAAPVMELRDVRKEYPARRGLFRLAGGAVRAVDGVTFGIGAAETLGLVGESGCGKSTLARIILRLVAPTAGSVLVEDQDVTRLPPSAVAAFRRKVQMVFQDPYSSLNPRITAGGLVAEPLLIHGLARRSEVTAEVSRLARQVGLPPDMMGRYPHEFSGGQRQRLAIARALAVGPKILVADEPVSALDVSIRAQVLNLFADLQAQRGLSYLFISHDLAVIAYISHRIAVMYLGAIVEIGPAAEILRHPLHPYTEMLLEAVPAAHPRLRRSRQRQASSEIETRPASSQGCRFAGRCPLAVERCRSEEPALHQAAPGRRVACHLR